MSELSSPRRQREPIGIFYDGGFTEKIRQRRAYPPNFYSDLQSAIVSSTVAVLNSAGCYVVSSNWFRGMLTSSQVKYMKAGRDEQVKFYECERRLSEELLSTGIETYRRLMPDSNKEKGIDCLLFAKAIRCIEHENPTAIVLVAGDSDHVTLLEEASRRGVRTISVWCEDPGVTHSHSLPERADWNFRVAFSPNLQLFPPPPPEPSRTPTPRTTAFPANVVPTPGRPDPL
jgi:uncharacterized LabA/DUF88 family protein